MRSIALKLTLAFLLVGLIGSALSAFLVQYRTRQEFDRLIKNQNQPNLVLLLTEYYQENRGWNGVDTILRSPWREFPPAMNPEDRFEMRLPIFTLTNADGIVVFGQDPNQPGFTKSQSELEEGKPIEVDGEVVGWLLFNPAFQRWRPGSPEQRFLSGVNNAILLSAVVATALALVMGGILAFTLTRSLRELTAATKELAKGRLGHQVKVRSRDELGNLAGSFNLMSAELARSNQLRRQMTVDIAHDLRTPLSVILGYTESFSDGKIDPTPETFNVMHREARHLNRLIEDLKTLSSADAGELPLIYQEISPEVLLRRIVEAYRIKADQKEIALMISSAPDLPEIEIDVERMTQVLGNLMSNAFRYTPAGGEIVLSANAEEETVNLCVIDNGRGITPEDLPNIFERSYRGDAARQLGEGETGLGLAIAKSLVEAQGGKISVLSTLGHGTTFTIHLPRKLSRS